MKNFQNKTKIIKVSKIIRSILFAGLILWIGGGIPIILVQAFNLWKNIGSKATLSLQGGVVVLIIFSFVVNLFLFRFFDRLKNGFLFDTKTVGHLNSAGKWWIVLWLIEFLFYQIGHEIFHISNGWGFSNLFSGLALIFVAWLLREAQELQEEQELTV